MSRYIQLRLAAAAVGVAVWGYGYRADDSRLRWIGICFLLVALAMRLIPRRFRGEPPPEA